MIFTAPAIGSRLRKQLSELDRLREELGGEGERMTPWMGTLRRAFRASSIESSASIEGYSVEPGEALALTEAGAAEPGDDESRQAIACYARAMDHVAAMAQDPRFRWSDRVILDLHFDACHSQADKSPGLWRDGPISVTGAGGEIEYRGPDAEEVPALMVEVVEWLDAGGGSAHPIVTAAMAHLDVISVHPFRDGNGRVARIVQSLVLAREGLLSPELSSIEEQLSRDTPAYYAALRETQGGSYRPQRDAAGWVEFCLHAHLAQAGRRLDQIRTAARRWELLEAEVTRRGWPDRFTIALERCLVVGIDRAEYGSEADVSPATVSADLRRLLDSGLVRQEGRGPGTRYWASKALRSLLAG